MFHRYVSARLRPMVAAALLGTASVPPAAAATLENLELPVPVWDAALFFGSIALLAIGLVLRAAQRRRHADLPPSGPDMRWWKNP